MSNEIWKTVTDESGSIVSLQCEHQPKSAIKDSGDRETLANLDFGFGMEYYFEQTGNHLKYAGVECFAEGRMCRTFEDEAGNLVEIASGRYW